MKLLIKVLGTLLALNVLIVPVYANEISESDTSVIAPFFTYINFFINDFDISSDGKASINAYLNARNVDSVKTEADLQRLENGKWKSVKSWSNTEDALSCGIVEDWYVVSGFSYRLVSNAYVYQNGKMVESTSFTSKSVSY